MCLSVIDGALSPLPLPLPALWAPHSLVPVASISASEPQRITHHVAVYKQSMPRTDLNERPIGNKTGSLTVFNISYTQRDTWTNAIDHTSKTNTPCSGLLPAERTLPYTFSLTFWSPWTFPVDYMCYNVAILIYCIPNTKSEMALLKTAKMCFNWCDLEINWIELNWIKRICQSRYSQHSGGVTYRNRRRVLGENVHRREGKVQGGLFEGKTSRGMSDTRTFTSKVMSYLTDLWNLIKSLLVIIAHTLMYLGGPRGSRALKNKSETH